MKNLRYIGPFLRINNLSKEIIESQLFHFAKESTKHIILKSKCGINIPLKELKIKSFSNIDITTFKEISPLLCVYKRSSTKLLTHKNNMFWDEDSFKKEVTISSNGYLTLCLLELAKYYKNFENIDKELYTLHHMYMELSRAQLDFYSSYLRNEEGLFVDKKDISDDITNELKFEDKNKKFKYSNQILMMNCYALYAKLSENKEAEIYENFSNDILNMILNYREEIYNLSLNEKINILSLLNIYLRFNEHNDVLLLSIDLMDLIYEQLKECTDSISISNTSLAFMTSMLFKHNTGISKYDEFNEDLYEKLLDLYDDERGIMIKTQSKKEIDYTSHEIVFYTLALLLKDKYNSDECNNLKTESIYRKQLINSGVICSWPDSPTLNSVERYKNYSLKSEDLIDEMYFKLPTIPSPESSGMAPVMLKNINYNTKKDEFNVNKQVFESTKYFQILFYMIYFPSI